MILNCSHCILYSAQFEMKHKVRECYVLLEATHLIPMLTGSYSRIRDTFVPFEEVDPLVSLEDHKPCGCEPEKGCGACEILQTHTHTHTHVRRVRGSTRHYGIQVD